VKYIRDTTGRFSLRPYYEQIELDYECEQIITEFMRERYGNLILPIPTDALTKLIERDAADLDLYADLSGEAPGVQGVTDFYPDQKPKVRIAQELSEQEWREHRLRTTATHEYGHVKFHNHLWELEPSASHLFPDLARKASPRCKSVDIQHAPASDWMEWQAGYICGALLMPISPLKRLVADYFEQRGLYGSLKADSQHTTELKNTMVERFNVSPEAAHIRLLKLGYFSESETNLSLFR
jgi:Zn-dependent peptidase ImmA (M78 family)